jgi:3-oxoacyl-(acyl-carrier-protein) synthase
VTGFPVLGCGAVTPAGAGVDALWQACWDGPVARRAVDHFDTAGITDFPVGLVPDVDQLAPRGHARRWFDLALHAARQALAEAAPPDPGTAVVVATTDHAGTRAAGGVAGAGPGDLARTLGLTGPVLVVSNASAAGAAAITVGLDLLAAGAAPQVLVVAVDCVTRPGLYGLVALRALSRTGCRPFARGRDGIHVAEAAAAILLGGPRARPGDVGLLGAWVSNVATQLARPDPAGVADAIRRALDRSGRSAADVGHVNAHAAGTGQGDRAEMTALREVLGDRLVDLPVVSVKGVVGHCQGAAGVVEVIVALRAVREGKAPPLHTTGEIDPLWTEQNFGQRPGPVPLETALSISCGLGGANAAVLVGV